MSYLTETKMNLSLARLGYSVDENVLTVGNRTLPLEPVWVREYSPWTLVPFDGPDQIEESAVCLNPFIKPIGTPKFHSWMELAAEDQAITESTINVVRSVFKVLAPEIEVPESANPGPFGFNMGVTKNNQPQLWTFGNCACLQPNAQGFWVGDRDWADGYCEYDWHNIDADSQIWSLLAGIGYLATRCLEAGD